MRKDAGAARTASATLSVHRPCSRLWDKLESWASRWCKLSAGDASSSSIRPASGLPRTGRMRLRGDVRPGSSRRPHRSRSTGRRLADVADAERAVARLNRRPRSLANSEAIARLLLRAESVASSKIEGAGGRRPAAAQGAVRGRTSALDVEDVTATEVLNNIEAMRWAVDELAACRARSRSTGARDPPAPARRDAPRATYAGQLRDQQNWIGGSSYNPCSAAFVPPPPTTSRRSWRTCARSATRPICRRSPRRRSLHAQIETIHPFVDGNGRAGRALIHVILRRRGLAPVVLPPISLMLATWSTDYVSGLTADALPQAIPARKRPSKGIDRWVALVRRGDDARRGRRRALRGRASPRLEARLARARSAPCARARPSSCCCRALPGAPVLDGPDRGGADRPQRAGDQRRGGAAARRGDPEADELGRRNRVLEAPALIDVFNDLERRLAQPEGDTLQVAAEPERSRRSGSDDECPRWGSNPQPQRLKGARSTD